MSGIKKVVTYSWKKAKIYSSDGSLDTYTSFKRILKTSNGTLIGYSGSNGGGGGYAGYSENNGKTWQKSSGSYGFYYFIEADDGTLIASTDAINSSANGLKYSKDSGKTWQDSNVTSGNYRSLIKANNGWLVAGAYYYKDEYSTTYGGIKYSENQGRDWQNSNVTSGQYEIINADNGRLLASGCSLRRSLEDGAYVINTVEGSGSVKYSEDNGRTWQNSDLTGYTDRFTFIGKGHNGRLFIHSYNGGIKYSDNNGITWSDTSTSISKASDVVLIKADDKSLVIGSSNLGIYYSEDNGETWLSASPIFNGINFIKANDGTIIVGGYYTIGIKYSTDNGKTWQDSNLTEKGYKASNFSKISNGILFAEYHSKIIYSTDNGKTWKDDIKDGYGINGGVVIEAADGTIVGANGYRGMYYLSSSISFSGVENTFPEFKMAQELINKIKNLKERIAILENKNQNS